MNILLSAVGRRAYLVDYFKQIVHPLGGKVYATNTIAEATGFLSADVAKIVPPSADSSYIDVMVGLCKKWQIKLHFSLHDWDAPVIARARQRFIEIGTIPVMGSADLLATCLDKYATFLAMRKIGVPVPETVLTLSEAYELSDRVGYPLVVKPRWGQGSLGLFIAHDKRELDLSYQLSELVAKRERVYNELRDRCNVYSRRYFYPLLTDFAPYLYAHGTCPIAEDIAACVLTLPTCYDLALEDAKEIARDVLEIVKH